MISLHSLQFVLIAISPLLLAAQPLPPPPASLRWIEVGNGTAGGLDVQGRGWPLADMPTAFSRLPRSAHNCCAMDQGQVWKLADSPAGLKIRFATTARTIYVRWNLKPLNTSDTELLPTAQAYSRLVLTDTDSSASSNVRASPTPAQQALLSDWLWPTNARSGVDIYIQTSAQQMLWAISAGNNPTMNTEIISGKTQLYTGINPDTTNVLRNYTIYLPLWNQVTSMQVAAVDANLVPLPPPNAGRGRICWYGTSIIHGAAATRAGMAWVLQAERMLDMDGINLGFAGAGLMQPELPKFLAQISNTAIYVLDCEFNMDRFPPEQVLNLTLAFIRQLRQLAPKTPILLLEGHDHTAAWIVPALAAAQNATREAYRRAFNTLLAEGLTQLYYLNGAGKLGPIPLEAEQATVAGVHPLDLAGRHMATYVANQITLILNGSAVPAPQPLGPWPPAPQPAPPPPPSPPPPTTRFVEADELALEGLAFKNPASCRYCRLPVVNQSQIPASVWPLSLMSSGVLTRFSTNATTITVNVQRAAPPNPHDIQSYAGQRGLDLFADNGQGGWRWAANSQAASDPLNATWQIQGLAPAAGSGFRNYTLYLPIYAQTNSVQIGVPEGYDLQPAPRYPAGTAPIVIWASSIGQGCAAQNPGSTWPTQLQRLFDRRPLLNLGFAGQCHFQVEIAQLIGTIQPPPVAVMMDCLPNTCGGYGNLQACVDSTQRAATAAILALRQGLPATTNIIVLEGHTKANDWIFPAQAAMEQAARQGQQLAVAALQKTMKNLYYVKGDGKLGPDFEIANESTAAVGVHPTGIAHLHIAQYVLNATRQWLE